MSKISRENAQEILLQIWKRRIKSMKKLTDEQIQNDYTNRIMNIIAMRCSYYRSNPHRFVKDFLNIDLKLFQKILLWCMFFYDALCDCRLVDYYKRIYDRKNK